MKDLIAKLEEPIRFLRYPNLVEEGFYKVTVAAALIKSYEFMKLFADHNEDSNVYFTLGSLRGICEDFIVLSFLKTLDSEERDKAVATTFHLKMGEAIQRQKTFFENERKFQPVVKPQEVGNELIEKCRQELKDIGGRTGAWGKNTPMPKIHNMAESLGLSDFYQYFYTLSSETVHFNPRILLRMGWSEQEDIKNFHFSTENFSHYYREYGYVYSTLLFIRFSRQFSDIAGFPEGFMDSVEAINKELLGLLRWPEPVTFEELNIEGPKTFYRVLLKFCTKLLEEETSRPSNMT